MAVGEPLPAGTADLPAVPPTDGVAESGAPWPRVHAYNILRLMFEEKALYADSGSYLAAGAPVAWLMDWLMNNLQYETLNHVMLVSCLGPQTSESVAALTVKSS